MSVCSATFEGAKTLLLRQVDDFAVVCPAEDIAKRPHAQIGKALQLPSEDAPPFKHLGLVSNFNGLDVVGSALTPSSSLVRSASTVS